VVNIRLSNRYPQTLSHFNLVQYSSTIQRKLNSFFISFGPLLPYTEKNHTPSVPPLSNLCILQHLRGCRLIHVNLLPACAFRPALRRYRDPNCLNNIREIQQDQLIVIEDSYLRSRTTMYVVEVSTNCFETLTLVTRIVCCSAERMQESANTSNTFIPDNQHGIRKFSREHNPEWKN